MKIRMLKTTQGSLNGINLTTFQAGEEYDIPEQLAEVFVKTMRVAVEAKEEKMMSGKEEGVLEEQAFDSEKPANKGKGKK